MNQITLKAIARARLGDFSILDALELICRHKSNDDVIGISHAIGCEVRLGIATPAKGEQVPLPDCDFCEGDGEVAVEGANGRTRYVSCPECDGFCSSHDPASQGFGDVARWTDLNGNGNFKDIGSFGFMSISQALAIVKKAEEDTSPQAIAA